MVTVIQEEGGGDYGVDIESEEPTDLAKREDGEGNTEEPTTEIATLSLNSLAGLGTPKTLKLRGVAHDKEVIVLIDSGATHNFISEEIVHQLEIPISNSASYGVVLGIGESVRAAGVCKGVVLTIDEVTIVQNFLPLPLGSADIILGVAWLETLGKIQFDYRLSIMDFQVGDWKVHLKGDRGLVNPKFLLNL